VRAGEAPEVVTLEYARAFQLTDLADADRVQASAKDGLVKVLVPRKVPAQRRIALAAG
jgi:HSP20 family molecular chaperone IbpA